MPQHASRRTPRELDLLAGLTPHTRAHVVYLLGAHCSLTLTAGRGTPVGHPRPARCGDPSESDGQAVTLIGGLAVLQEAARVVWRQRVGRLCRGPHVVELERSGLPGQQLRIAW